MILIKIILMNILCIARHILINFNFFILGVCHRCIHLFIFAYVLFFTMNNMCMYGMHVVCMYCIYIFCHSFGTRGK